MMQSIFILSPTGEVLIERHFRGSTPRTVVGWFWERASADIHHHGGLSTTSTIIDYNDSLRDTVAPVMKYQCSDEKRTLYLFSIVRDGLSYLAVCPGEMSPLLVLEFLHRIADIFVEYFGTPADESAIKENFSIAYQLIEEMTDFGWPLTTEPNALKAMIRPPTVMEKIQSVVTGGSSAIVTEALPSGTVSNMPWRAAGVRYNQNEIYIDIIEEIDAIVDSSGNVVSSDVSGFVKAQSHLSGVPDLLLTFKDPHIIDDCSFHPCVRYSRYEMDGVVSFVPPDGNFELMKYRVKPSLLQGFFPPVYVSPQWAFSETDGNATLIVGTRTTSSLVLSASRKTLGHVEDVAVTVPLPKSVKTAKITVTHGAFVYDEVGKILKWVLGKLEMNYSAKPRLQLSMQVNSKPDSNPHVALDWRVPLASVSGLSVSGLSLTGEAYKPYKGVRNITQSGRFQVRGN